MTTYTPGPWKLSDPVNEQPVLAYRILGANFPQGGLDSIVADLVWQTENDNELFQRNARLIAASPGLLEALKEVLSLRDWVVRCGGAKGPLAQDVIKQFAEMQIGILDRAEAAVAAAEGRARA